MLNIYRLCKSLKLVTLSRYFLVLTFTILVYSTKAQTGNAFISNYNYTASSGQVRIHDIVQDEQNVLLMATAKGLLTFDGNNWKLAKTNVSILSLHHAKGQIFVTSAAGWGHAVKNASGAYQYVEFTDSLDKSESFWEILESDSTIFFCGTHHIAEYSPEQKKVVNRWEAPNGEPFLGTFLYQNEAYVNLDKRGVQKLENFSFRPVSCPPEVLEAEILFSIEKDSLSWIGFDNNQIWSFDGTTFSRFQMECGDYLQESDIANGLLLDDNRMVISTLTGGCVIIDVKTGKTLDVINYQTGLADDEVLALTKDNNGGLWIAHEFGLSRANLHFPIKEYNTYPGLEGNLLSVYVSEKRVFVATSEGVYYLDEVKDYKEIEVLIKKQIEKAVPIETNYISPVLVEEIQQQEVELAKEFSRREQRKTKRKNRRKRKRKNEPVNETLPDSSAIDSSVQVLVPALSPSYSEPIEIEERQKIYALQSIKHLFKQVEGIEDKCKELIGVGDDLFVAGNKGLYFISDHKSQTLLSDVYVNKLYKSRYSDRLFVGGDKGFYVLEKQKGGWSLQSKFDDFNHKIISIVEQDQRHLWLGSENIAFQVQLDIASNPISITPYSFSTETTEDVYVREIYGKPFFFLRSGIYGYDVDKDKMYYNNEVNERFFNRYKYIFSQNTITWILSNGEWVNINHEPELLSLKSFYLNLFDNIQNIFVDENQNLWVIDGNDKIYFVKASEIPNTEQKFDIFFQQVRNTEGLYFTLNQLHFDYQNSGLTFSISAPYYVKAKSTLYQYKIEGLMKEWSNWSTNTEIDFPFIPEGNYRLLVRAQNVFGNESEVKELAFVIHPPFYRTFWFYLLVVFTSICGVIALVKLREKNLKREQTLLEEKVKLRTQQLHLEKQKSDDLLLNILPAETAEELKSKGKATARYYNLTTVLFTDFKGFTQISESITPVELVKELDDCFVGFDDIVEEHNIEKIKTIGDAYMCVGGVPSRNQSNPIDTVLAGLAITDYMNTLKQQREKEDIPFWELRLGIHTGPLIAGVVGKKKFAYDVWGDTVNTASRMESSGEPGKVNISSSTHELVKKYFDCTSRGKVAAKNKGELDMYFVDRIKAEYAEDREGRKPNDKLRQIVNDLT